MQCVQLLWRLKRVEANLGAAWLVGRAEVERTLSKMASYGCGEFVCACCAGARCGRQDRQDSVYPGVGLG